ncbi:MAG TPA: hypothetical protein VGK48_05305 [Terriglobia bacterium]|jgi:hypothetical protein
MSDKEIIVASLQRVERRIRANRLLNELTFGALVCGAILLLVKIWDLFDPLPGVTVSTIVGICVLLFAAYAGYRVFQKGTLNDAASSADSRAGMHDELKTAFWFVNNPRPSDWVDAQVHRAARNAQALKLDALYPRHIPKTSFIAASMILLFVGLNFVPMSFNHNWLALQAAPAFALSEKEAAIVKQTKELIHKAEKLKQSDLAQRLEDVVQQLQDGKIDPQQAAQMLDNIQNQLEEGNLDAASINEGLEEMAKDLAQSEQLDPAAQAMQNKQLNLAADELRKLADKLGLNTAGQTKDIQKSLEQAAENTRPGLEDLAEMLKQAAENLKNGQQDAAQQGLDGAAQQLEALQQRIESQDLKNLASQDLQNLKDSLQQRGQQSAGQKGGKGQQQQAGKAQGGQNQKAQPGQTDPNAQGQAQDGGEGEPTDQTAQNDGSQNAAPVPGGGNGNGLMPSGKGGADAPREGAATKLDVKLKQEKVDGMSDGGEKPEKLEEISKQERSMLDYRNVKSDLTPAQKDLLNQDRIPWEYRPLIKNYFQAIRPAANGKK